MAIQFKYQGVTYTTDTAEEADDMIALLKKREADALMEQMRARGMGYRTEFQKMLDPLVFHWAPDMFFGFLSRLGEPQKAVLAQLVTRGRVSDEELRNALGVTGNQALAGILSGISKQAAALNIPARAIFSFENSRVGGKRSSEYLVAPEFRQIASEQNWPEQA